MRHCQRLATSFLFAAIALLSGCSLLPAQEGVAGSPDSSATSEHDRGEGSPGMCQCPDDTQLDQFSLALQALAGGDYETARSAFTRHAEVGSEPNLSEAAAGIALADILAQNGSDSATGADADSDRAALIQMVVSLIADLQGQVADLEDQKATLTADLEKQEEALKRLRELTLGQPEG